MTTERGTQARKPHLLSDYDYMSHLIYPWICVSSEDTGCQIAWNSTQYTGNILPRYFIY